MGKKCCGFCYSFKKSTHIATIIYINVYVCVCVCVCVYTFMLVERSSVLKKHKHPFDHFSSILRSTIPLGVFFKHTLWDPSETFISNTDAWVFQSPLRIFHNLKDVGFLQVKVIRAEGLMAADVTGKKECCSPVACISSSTRHLPHLLIENFMSPMG